MNSESSPVRSSVSDLMLNELRYVVLVAVTLVTLFVGRQAWLQQQAVVASRPNVERLRAELGKMAAIRDAFARFGADHKTFLPVLNKYGIQPPGAAAPSVPRP
jgi:hypothetical protein